MNRGDDVRLCAGPTCREAIRFVTVEGNRVVVNASPDPDGSVVVFGKDSGVRMTPDQRATLRSGNVYKDHECPDVVYLRLKQRDASPQRSRKYAGARR
jgi:hypothetical protein